MLAHNLEERGILVRTYEKYNSLNYKNYCFSDNAQCST